MRRRGTRDKNHQECGTHLSIFASSTDPDEEAFRDGLSAGLAALPEEQRSVIHLKLREGLTFEHRPHRGAAIAKSNGNRCPERSNERPGVGCVRLETYRNVRGHYPAALNDLVPTFLEKLPSDLIGGAPLKYQRVLENGFRLYSVGWNGKEDGGKGDATNYEQPDWVWPGSN